MKSVMSQKETVERILENIFSFTVLFDSVFLNNSKSVRSYCCCFVFIHYSYLYLILYVCFLFYLFNVPFYIRRFFLKPFIFHSLNFLFPLKIQIFYFYFLKIRLDFFFNFSFSIFFFFSFSISFFLYVFLILFCFFSIF